MWAFFGVVLAVLLHRYSVGADWDDINIGVACSDMVFPTHVENIHWDRLKSRLGSSLNMCCTYFSQSINFYEYAVQFEGPREWKFVEGSCRSQEWRGCSITKTYTGLNSIKDVITDLLTCASYFGTESRIPVQQLQYVSKLFSLLNREVVNRREICDITRSVGRSATKPLRDRVSEVCVTNEQDNLCQLTPFFELTNIFEDIICNTTKLDEASWNKGSKVFNISRSSVNILLYAFKREMHSKYSSSVDLSAITEQKVIESLHYILTELYEDVKNNDMLIRSELEIISAIVPSKARLIGSGIVDYPSFKWIVSTGLNTLKQVRSFVARYGVGNSELKQKGLDTQIDYRQYIQTLKTTQIKEMTDSIPSNVQALGNGIGTYFRQVATYEKSKKTADISYLQTTINKYKQAFDEATSELSSTMAPVLVIYGIAASAELIEDTAILVVQIAKAGNPLKWLFGSGNADEVMESTAAVAESARKLTDALRNIEAFVTLIKYNDNIAKKLLKNGGPLKTVGTLLKGIEKESNSTEFSKLQDEFISQYSGYTPAIRKDELKELTVQWENLIDAICTGVENTGGVAANSARGIGNTNGKCLDAKRSAAKLTICLEEIFDFQFQLMESMASLMHSFVQIESTKALISSSTDTLTTKDFQTIATIIGLSYKMTQANNVEMLCNIMEYQNAGNMPSECKGGLSTDIDVLTSIEKTNYNIKRKYVEVPAQRNIPVKDSLAWFDLAKLYAGETVLFQVPNSAWLVKHGWIPTNLKNNALYVKELSMVLPVVSQNRSRQIEVTVTPSYVGNKLHDNSNTYYSIAHAHKMAFSYIEGERHHTCLIQPKIINPYKRNGCNQDSDYPALCRTSEGTTTQIRDFLYPSIYSEFVVKIDGYADAKLDAPATKMGVQIGLTYYFLSENQRRKRTTMIEQKAIQKRQASCCPHNNYFNYDNNQCQACPSGTQSYYDGLFCGDLLKLVEANVTKTPMNATFTYAMAVTRCKESGSVGIANLTRVFEAAALGAKSCTCGWIEGEKVVSVGSRSDCKSLQAQCSAGNNIRHVYCKTRYKP